MLDKRVLGTKDIKNMSFLPQKLVRRESWIDGPKKHTIIDDDFHGKKCNQIFTQMNGYNILISHKLWFRVIKIKMN
jgi:hypothetical protein